MNVQLLRLLPLLEQAPDQIASRPLEAVSVIDVPVVNDAELRAGLAKVRELVADVPQRARALTRTFGR